MTPSLPQRIQLSDDVLFRELDGEAVLLDLQSERYYGLDSVGTRIWQLFAEHQTTTAVIEAMLGEYDVTEEQLTQDMSDLLTRLAEASLITLDPD